ncbi:MAG: Asp23/Gls24 family envelope stress response protein [Clostridiales bacterium]|nr:Asp23/Gls24 family envelope stress response protein [Clostridiales bacterium]
MNENVTIDMERDQESGQITYANEVIATIVSVATTEVDGISGIAGSSSLSGILAKGKTPRGVKVDIDGQNVGVDVSVTVDYGMPIQKVGRNAQENVRKSIESMTGLHVEKVDLHVVGVSFEKENQEMQQSQKLALSIEEEKEHAIAAEENAALTQSNDEVVIDPLSSSSYPDEDDEEDAVDTSGTEEPAADEEQKDLSLE